MALHELYKYINKYYDQVCLHPAVVSQHILAEYHNISHLFAKCFNFNKTQVQQQLKEIFEVIRYDQKQSSKPLHLKTDQKVCERYKKVTI